MCKVLVSASLLVRYDDEYNVVFGKMYVSVKGEGMHPAAVMPIDCMFVCYEAYRPRRYIDVGRQRRLERTREQSDGESEAAASG